MREYAKRDVIKLGDYYTRHVAAMTSEGLHSKSDIAPELAWRDMIIDKHQRTIDTLYEIQDELTKK